MTISFLPRLKDSYFTDSNVNPESFSALHIHKTYKALQDKRHYSGLITKQAPAGPATLL